MSDTEATEVSISNTLRGVLASHLRNIPDNVDWATVTLSDFGLDSLSAIDLVVDIEDTFGAQFPAELLVRETFATFNSLEAVVRSVVLRP